MRYVILIAMALALSGCNQAAITQYRTQYQAVIPPDTLYECPATPAKPRISTLKDSQIAEYMVRLDRAHKICSRSITALKAFADQAKLTIEAVPPQ